MPGLTRTRWGNRSRADSDDAAREQILQAARACYARQGIGHTTVEAVARAACISRTTVYRYFRNRDELLTAVVMADSRLLLAYVEHRLADTEDFSDFLIEAMLLVLREAPKAPLYRAFLAPGDSAALIGRLCLSSAELTALLWPVLEPRLLASRQAGQVRADLALPGLIEWVARLLLSFMNLPSPQAADEAALRALFRSFLRPALLPVA